MQKYRADKATRQADGAIVWREWWGGEPLARINNCRIESMAGEMRRSVYVTGEADTWFSIPASCRIQGCYVRGYITSDDERNYVFRHCYY
jgi:hypothetical protein